MNPSSKWQINNNNAKKFSIPLEPSDTSGPAIASVDQNAFQMATQKPSETSLMLSVRSVNKFEA